MKNGFTPISLDEYVEKYLQSNPGEKRAALLGRLEQTISAHRAGERCSCGAPIWIIGSAEVGLSCFTCITGEGYPDDDYEIDLRALESPTPRGARKG